LRKIVEKDQREVSAEREHRRITGLLVKGSIEIRALAKVNAIVIFSQEEKKASDLADPVSRRIVVAFEGMAVEQVGTAAVEEAPGNPWVEKMDANSVGIALVKQETSRPLAAADHLGLAADHLGLLVRRAVVAPRRVGSGGGKRKAAAQKIGGSPLEAVKREVLLAEKVPFTVIQMRSLKVAKGRKAYLAKGT
jgi:hypothetical protein